MGNDWSDGVPDSDKGSALIPTRGLEGCLDCSSAEIGNNIRDVVYTFQDYDQNEWTQSVFPRLEAAVKEYRCGWPVYAAGDTALRSALRTSTSVSTRFRYQLFDTQADGHIDHNNNAATIFIKVTRKESGRSYNPKKVSGYHSDSSYESLSDDDGDQMGRRVVKDGKYKMSGVSSEKSLNNRVEVRVKRHTLMGAVGSSFKKIKHKVVVTAKKGKGKKKVAAGGGNAPATAGKERPQDEVHAGHSHGHHGHGAHGEQEGGGMLSHLHKGGSKVKEHGDKEKAGFGKHSGHGHLRGKVGTHSAAESVSILKQTPKEDARGRYHQTNKSAAMRDEDDNHSHKAATKLQSIARGNAHRKSTTHKKNMGAGHDP